MSKSKGKIRRPAFTEDDISTFAFMLASMRDDRNRTTDFKYDRRYDQAEELAKRILADSYVRPY